MHIGIDARMYKKHGTGISRYIFELISRLPHLSSRHHFTIFLSPEMYDDFQAPQNVSKVQTDVGYYSLKEQTHFMKMLYAAKLDLMHFTHFNAPVLYYKPSVVTIHDLTLSKFQGQKMKTWLHKKGYEFVIWSNVKKAKRIITVSDHTKKDVINTFHIASKRIYTTYLGVDSFERSSISAIKQCRKKFGIQKPCLLYVGVWRNHKNMLNLIECFNVLRDNGKELQLIMTGKESPYYPEIREAIEKSPHKNDIITPGFVSEEDLHNLYSSVQMLVNPSFYEGFGIPPLEAMASGCLVAVSRVSSHPEICGEAALYFDPYSVSDMVRVIQNGLEDEILQEEMISKGLKHTQSFRWDKTAQDTLSVYETVWKN